MLVATSLGDAGTARDTVDVVIKLDGSRLDSDAMARVQDISIAKALDEAGQLTIRLTAWDSDAEELVWVDDDVFAPGTAVEVEAGYAGQPAPLFHGEIVSLDLEMSADARAVLTITAYDVLHRLGRGRRSAPYMKKTYADIVRDIARESYNLEVDAEDDAALDPARAIVHQENESDLSFVLGLARQIGFELFADASKIVFRKSRLGDPPELTLDLARDLIRFSAHLAAASQLGGVDVIALHTDSKERIQASEDNPDTADDAFRAGATREVIVEDALTTQDQAKARAKAELARIRGGYLHATATALGRPDLAAGMMIRIDNLGARFSGAYYVTSVTHSLAATGGLRTSFTLKGQPR